MRVEYNCRRAQYWAKCVEYSGVRAEY